MRGGDSPCFRRVATHPPSLPHQRILFGLLSAVVDERQQGECRVGPEPCRDHDADEQACLCPWTVVDDHSRPGAVEGEAGQPEQLDVVPQLGVVEPGDDAQSTVYYGIPSVFDEPDDSVHVLVLPLFS